MSAAIESPRGASRDAGARVRLSVAWPMTLSAVFVAITAVAAAVAPVWLSIVAVFVFAGPHNWIEARYFLARLPGRWGRSRVFYGLAIVGAVSLTALYLGMVPLARTLDVGVADANVLVASWATLAVAWIVTVVAVLGGQMRHDWTWAIPVGLFVVAAAWWSPGVWWLGLVYGHPLVALLFLDHELRLRPDVRRAVRCVCAALPVLVAGIWIVSASGGPLGGVDGLTMRIADHAGASILPSIPDRALIATHAFLETVHYGVWVIAIPCLGFRSAPWSMAGIQLARRSRLAALAVGAFLIGGIVCVAALWTSFAIDYATTRDVYFALAMLHVLVEAPFIVRMMMTRGVSRVAG